MLVICSNITFTSTSFYTLARALSTVGSTAAFDKHPQSQQRGITLDLGKQYPPMICILCATSCFKSYGSFPPQAFLPLWYPCRSI